MTFCSSEDVFRGTLAYFLSRWVKDTDVLVETSPVKVAREHKIQKHLQETFRADKREASLLSVTL